MRRVNDTLGEQRGSEYDDEEDEDDAQYLLLISPRQNFAWTGAVMTLDVGKGVNLGLEDSRIRLVADGPTTRLAYCKAFFVRSFIDPETDVATLQPLCIVEQQHICPRSTTSSRGSPDLPTDYPNTSSSRPRSCVGRSAEILVRKTSSKTGTSLPVITVTELPSTWTTWPGQDSVDCS
jgi:hypothetical protein